MRLLPTHSLLLPLWLFALSFFIIYGAWWLCKRLRWTKPNWRGEHVPMGLGITFPLVWIATDLAGSFSFGRYLLFFSIIGLVDDLWGDRSVGGLKGHFRVFLQERRLTTGALKCVCIGLYSLWLAYAYHRSRALHPLWLSVLTSALLIALCTNAINLLDVRPGRALKGLAMLCLLILFPTVLFTSTGKQVSGALAGPVGLYLIPVLCYAPLDFRGRAMMGDAGSNALGALAGLYAVKTMSLPAQAMLTALLIFFHLFTEKHSVTTFFAQHPALDWLDRLGTGRPRETNNSFAERHRKESPSAPWQ